MALEVRSIGSSGCALLCHAVWNSAEPRWLVKKRRIDEARQVLRLIGDENFEHDLQAIVGSIDLEHKSKDRLFTRRYAFPIFLAISIGMFNQLAGINAILYYLNDIFARAGFSKVSADLQSVAVGLTLLVFTMLGMTLIDKLGRRMLLLIGSVGTAVCLTGIAGIFWSRKHQHALLWLADRLHRILRIFSGRRNLGIYQRDISQSGSCKGTKPGQLFSLVYECNHLWVLPFVGCVCGLVSLRPVRDDDGGAILCRMVHLSGNEGHRSRRYAAAVAYLLIRD